MTAVREATQDENDLIAGFWNIMATKPESCWYKADTVVGSTIATHREHDVIFMIATEDVDNHMVGFGCWRVTEDRLQLIALAAEVQSVYYHLMVAYTAWGLSHGIVNGYAEIATRRTNEKGWMDALSPPIAQTPLSHDVDQSNPDLRVIGMLTVTCNLVELQQAAQAKLAA